MVQEVDMVSFAKKVNHEPISHDKRKIKEDKLCKYINSKIEIASANLTKKQKSSNDKNCKGDSQVRKRAERAGLIKNLHKKSQSVINENSSVN